MTSVGSSPHSPPGLPRLYTDLAWLWPLLSPPQYYSEEAATVSALIRTAAAPATVSSVLELGSGAGHLSSHLRAHFHMTLVDRSEQMLELSRKLNPGCPHRQGDMDVIRLGERFDAVLIYDAVTYITSETGLERVLATARAHLERGGVLLLGPDAFRETFEERTYRGEHDDGDLRFRYLERSYDPDPEDSLVTSDFVFEIQRSDDPPRTFHDRHTFGLFSRDTWLGLLSRNGFSSRIQSSPGHRDFLVGVA
jgi:SAM-dependent methyltransferase